MDLEQQLIQTLVYKGEPLPSLILYPEQLELWDKYLEARTSGALEPIVATFSRKTGKTFSAVTIAFAVALLKPNASILYAAPTREMLKKFVIPVINEICQYLPKELRPKRKGYEYKFANGSELKIEGADFKGGDNLRGPKADLIVIDEAAFFKADLEDLIASVFTPMITHTNGKIIVCSTPPRTIAHKYFKLVMDAIADNRHILKTIYDCTLYKHDQAKINRIIKTNKGTDSISFRREYMCEFITDPSARIVPEYEDKIHDILEAQFGEWPEHYQPYVCIDWGYKHNTGIVFCVYNFLTQRLIVVDEITVKAKTTGEIADILRKKEHELWGKYLRDNPEIKVKRWGDNNLQLCSDMTRDHKMLVVAIRKISLDATVASLRHNINTRIVVTKNCPNTRWQLANGVWDDNRKKFEEGQSVPKNEDEDREEEMIGHCDNLAALMYLNRHIEWRANPAPQTKLDPTQVFSKNGYTNTPTGHKPQTYRKIFKLRS